jgi:hypothetical protein
LKAADTCLMKRVHDLAKDVDLQLIRGGVADLHRLRALVARQPGDLPFGEPFLASKAIHDLNLRRTPRRGSQQPIAPTSRPEIRARVCARCAWLGVILDERANSDGETRITSEASRVRVYVVPTDEERMIAEHTAKHVA